MPSGVGAFHSGIEFGANKYRTEQAAAAKLAGEQADDRRLNLNDFFARIGELEAALAPDKYDPQMEESLLAKAREIDRQYGDITDLRATRMVLSRLGRPTELTAAQKIGPIGDIPAPTVSPNAGFPSAVAKATYDKKLTTTQQDALFAQEGGVLTQKWMEQIEASGGLDDPNIGQTIADLMPEASDRYGRKNAEAVADQMLQFVEAGHAAHREKRLSEKGAAAKGIDPKESRLVTTAVEKWFEQSVLGAEVNPLTGAIKINLQGTQAMRAAGQKYMYRMVGKGMRSDQIQTRIMEMYADSSGAINPVVPPGSPPPMPWSNTIPEATERQREMVRNLYQSDAYDPTEWKPVVVNGELAMVNLDTGDVSRPKSSAGTVGVPDALKPPVAAERPAAPLPGAEPAATTPAAPAGPPSPLDRSLRGIGLGVEGTAKGIGAAAQGVRAAGGAAAGGMAELMDMITRGGRK